MSHQKFLECLVILCFESRYPKQNTVARLKTSICLPLQYFWPHPKFRAGYATDVPVRQNYLADKCLFKNNRFFALPRLSFCRITISGRIEFLVGFLVGLKKTPGSHTPGVTNNRFSQYHSLQRQTMPDISANVDLCIAV